MNKRSFLKATGVSFVASLFAAPFLGRRESVANAQEESGLTKKVSDLSDMLRKEIARLDEEIEHRKAEDDAIKRSLEASFIGTVTAIASNKIPYGWHLCDGTTIPDAPEYKRLKDLTGLTHFPDYRGVFLRGLDEAATDGSAARGFDPGRTLDGKVQDSANKSHNHPCNTDGAHGHQTDSKGSHRHGFDYNTGFRYQRECPHFDYKSKVPFGRLDRNVDPNVPTDELLITQFAGEHTHAIPSSGAHAHGIQNNGGPESRPRNVAVRYIIKYR